MLNPSGTDEPIPPSPPWIWREESGNWPGSSAAPTSQKPPSRAQKRCLPEFQRSPDSWSGDLFVKEENLRDKIYIADKFPIWEANKEEDFYRILDEQLNKLSELYLDNFKKVSSNDNIKVKAEAMKSSMPGIILLSEESRRMQEMAKMYGGLGFPMQDDITLVLNANNKTVQKLLELKDNNSDNEKIDIICGQIYDLAMLAHKPMEAADITRFIERSAMILDLYSN